MQFTCLGKMVYLNGYSDSDWIFSTIRKTSSFYEIDLLKYMRHSLAKMPKGCILDIGANIGNHSVFFGLFLAKIVICIEPNPKVIPILIDNLLSNSIKHKVFNVGLGNRRTKAIVELPNEHANNIGGAKLVEVQPGDDSPSDAVPVVPLDSLLQDIEKLLEGQHISAMKIDVEGMESAVLSGGIHLLEKYKPELFVEIADSAQMESILSVLRPLGYRPIVSWAATPVWHFVHRDKLTILRMLKLYTYISIHKKKSVLRRFTPRIWLYFG